MLISLAVFCEHETSNVFRQRLVSPLHRSGFLRMQNTDLHSDYATDIGQATYDTTHKVFNSIRPKKIHRTRNSNPILTNDMATIFARSSGNVFALVLFRGDVNYGEKHKLSTLFFDFVV